jgi:hypothetical protein
MLLCFQIRVNFTLVLCIACYHFEFGIAGFLVAAIVGDRSASQAQYLLENIGRKVISVY